MLKRTYICNIPDGYELAGISRNKSFLYLRNHDNMYDIHIYNYETEEFLKNRLMGREGRFVVCDNTKLLYLHHYSKFRIYDLYGNLLKSMKLHGTITYAIDYNHIIYRKSGYYCKYNIWTRQCVNQIDMNNYYTLLYNRIMQQFIMIELTGSCILLSILDCNLNILKTSHICTCMDTYRIYRISSIQYTPYILLDYKHNYTCMRMDGSIIFQFKSSYIYEYDGKLYVKSRHNKLYEVEIM